jgi:hypothetical protein
MQNQYSFLHNLKENMSDIFFYSPVNIWDAYNYHKATSVLNQNFKNLVHDNVSLMSFENLINIFADKISENMSVFTYLQYLPSYWNYYDFQKLNVFPYEVTFLYNYEQALFLLSSNLNLESLSYEFAKHVNYYNETSKLLMKLDEIRPKQCLLIII